MNAKLIDSAHSHPPRGATAADNDSRMAGPLVELLHELCEVLGRLSDEQYVQRPVGVIESSIGGHVRHCLDHVRSLLAALGSGHLDYDRRERGTPVESSREVAIAQIESLAESLARADVAALARPLRVSVTMSSAGPPFEVRSTVGRELAYVLSHTIHHNAIVNAMVRTLGGWLPERFGYAPATLKYLGKAVPGCAR